MLVVIFGAGASYDSAPDYSVGRTKSQQPEIHAKRFPLANELFTNRSDFRNARDRFKEMHPLLAFLGNATEARTVEQMLQKFQLESESNPERKKQLAAVRFYLRDLLISVETAWMQGVARGVTNHLTLVDRILHHRKTTEPICFVTFNYDTILESVLAKYQQEASNIDDPIAADPFKLFKLHGSVDWFRHIALGLKQRGRAMSREHDVIHSAPNLSIDGQFVLESSLGPSVSDRYPWFPAIAIPVDNKQDFECPPHHLGTLAQLLPHTTRILSIGWRAREAHFLALLTKYVKGPVSMVACSGDQAAATETLDRIRSSGVLTSRAEAMTGGFTEMVVNEQIDEFLVGI
jgi:hypothetical protein